MLRTLAKLLPVALIAALAAFALVRTGAAQGFNPSLRISLYNPNPSANSSAIIVTSLGSGDLAMGTWAMDLPAAWSVSGAAPPGDLVGEGTMSVDIDCDGSVDRIGPFPLNADVPDPQTIARWIAQINSWWQLAITVDTSGQVIDMAADLLNVSQTHSFCGPEIFALTVFGRSSPSNAIVLTNPNSAGSFTFNGSYVSVGGQYTAQATATVSTSTAPVPTTDVDGDGVVDENPCGSDPNNANSRPERIDGVFAGVDDNGNGLIDEMLPAGA